MGGPVSTEVERDEDVTEALLLDDDPQDDAINKLIDEDPDVRAAVAAEIKSRLMNPQPAAPQESPTAGVQTEMEKLREQINADEAWIDAFYEKPDSERNYTEFQRKQDAIRRNERRMRELEREEVRLTQNLNQSDSWIDAWVNEAKLRDPNVGRYGNIIKQMARQLPAQVLANREALRNSLQHYVEPNAFKRYALQNRQQRRQDPRQDTAGTGAYEESGDEAPVPGKQDKYADATPQEREFLRRVGLIKDEGKRGGNDLIPIEDGFIIPIGRGRRNDEVR